MKHRKENRRSAADVAHSDSGEDVAARLRMERVPSGTVSEGNVRGERGAPSVSTTRSLQSRVSSILACGAMLILGAGMLTWYYTGAISRQSRVSRNAQSAASRRAQGEMPLPALDGLTTLKISTSGDQRPPVDAHDPDEEPATAPTPVASAVLHQSTLPPTTRSTWEAASSPHGSYVIGARKSPEQQAQERMLSGTAFERQSGPREAFAGFPTTSAEGPAPVGVSQINTLAAKTAENSSSADDLGSLLRPTAVASAHARILPTRRLLLERGAFIDCTLETAISSALPGMTTCVTAMDTFSSDGTVVLLERGTKLIGETHGQVQQGSARVFVLWTEARTPMGIVVPLDSPGADELGRSGLPGTVDRHFWDRFGAAILISTLDGAVQAAAQSAGRGGGAVIYSPTASESVVTDVLKNSVNIAPTVSKRNGDRIQVLVARDLDFRQVYELREAAAVR
jgi:type IV secretion system protein VirB10